MHNQHKDFIGSLAEQEKVFIFIFSSITIVDDTRWTKKKFSLTASFFSLFVCFIFILITYGNDIFIRKFHANQWNNKKKWTKKNNNEGEKNSSSLKKKKNSLNSFDSSLYHENNNSDENHESQHMNIFFLYHRIIVSSKYFFLDIQEIHSTIAHHFIDNIHTHKKSWRTNKQKFNWIWI